MERLTPVMQQYMNIKNQNKQNLLFFRLGDFYEMFFEDAIVASKELSIALTSRNGDDKIPMCGVPYHSADAYIAKLIEKGHRVAICEQMEDPKTTKTLVKREVVRVITPGTVLDTNALDESSNNYIMCVYQDLSDFGVAVCDMTTGDFKTTQMSHTKTLFDEIAKFNPSELICNEGFHFKAEAEKLFNKNFQIYYEWSFHFKNAEKSIKEHFGVLNLEGLGFKGIDNAVCASGALLQYLYETQKSIRQISKINIYSLSKFMSLDLSSRRNLELTETMRDKAKKGSLLWVLDYTQTAMGARLLKLWLQQPLLDEEEIEKRLLSVEELKNDLMIREELKELLNTIYDLERICTKISYLTANGKDLITLKKSLEYLPDIKLILSGLNSGLLNELNNEFDVLADLFELTDKAIHEDCPVNVRDGNIIKAGYHAELDGLRAVKENVSGLLNQLEEYEKEKTGIKNLKIKFNKIFGFYIEITNSNLKSVPEYYIRRQTMANGERFTTTELKKIEDDYLGADEKISTLEQEVFKEVLNLIAKEQERIQKTASCIACLDVLRSLAHVAEYNNYCKPIVNNGSVIEIRNGRHPVIEQMTETSFIANDTLMDINENRLSVITGPNMAGKSTYMRQVALIVLMAQIGSFVPADYAQIGVVDKIFTRVGASDDLATGQSTFMVEMAEVANILNSATKNSLIVLDEIGRGTSTFDGLSIAWSVMEYIADVKTLGAKTLFATHYHELSELEGRVPGVKSFHFTVTELGEDIVFLRKIAKGGADNSYGIHVAKLAGIPVKVLKRSREILSALNQSDVVRHKEAGNDVFYETIKQRTPQQGIIIKNE